MKKMLKYFTATCALATLASCEPREFDKPDMGSLPNIENYEYEITPTEFPYRYILSLKNPEGVVGLWNFDGTTIVGNKITHDFFISGNNTVGLSVYNKAGVSTESKTVTVDVKSGMADVYLIGTWVWDKATSPHFGNSPLNGTAPGNGGWGSTAPDDALKADMYDDTLYFDADGTFRLDTGDGGKVGVNEEATNLPLFGPVSSSPTVRNFVQPANSGWKWEITSGSPYNILTLGGGFPSYVPSDSYTVDKYEIRILDAKTLYLRVPYEWGAFWMRFTHPAQ